MSIADEVFGGMANAEMSGKGKFMSEGKFLVRTALVKYKEGYKGKSFIVEFEILQSTNVAEHPVGSTGTWVVKLDKPDTRAMAWADIKGFVFAIAMGKNPKTVPGPKQAPELHAECTEIAKAAIADENAKALGVEPGFLNGLEVQLETVRTPRRDGGVWTNHAWSPVAAPTEAGAAQAAPYSPVAAPTEAGAAQAAPYLPVAAPTEAGAAQAAPYLPALAKIIASKKAGPHPDVPGLTGLSTELSNERPNAWHLTAHAVSGTKLAPKTLSPDPYAPGKLDQKKGKMAHR